MDVINMKVSIRQAQKMVIEHLEKIGYTKIETNPTEAYLHLVEEIGELARCLLFLTTERSSMANTTEPKDVEDELADVFWQTLKLASYLNLDMEDCFTKKYDKNMKKNIKP
jgi:NTP pyrophosphatase (non-canonical NTP hydrolase)